MGQLVPVKDLGRGGVVKDTQPALLPENVMTDALNVRFTDGSIETIPGESPIITGIGVNPEFGIHWRRPDNSYSVIINDGYAYAKNSAGSETALLTSSDSKYANSKWQLDRFGGGYAIFANNGKSTPLYALYSDPLANFSLQEFPGWNYQPGTTITAKVIRPFGYSLVAGNLTFTTGPNVTEAPVTIRISVQAVVGAFPSVWQPGLTTDTADEFEINASSPIQEMLELRGNMMVYTNDSIHALSLQGGVSSVRPLASGRGALGPNCVVEFDNNHFVVDQNDIYVHNGSGQFTSVAEAKIKKFFFLDLNPIHAANVFAIKNNKFKEIWLCYPSASSSGKCNKAAIWNYVDNTWTFRTLPNLTSMFISPLISSGLFRYSNGDTLLGCGDRAEVLIMDSGYFMFNPTTLTPESYPSYVTREKLFSGDPFGTNYISGIAPILQTFATDTVNVTVTSQNVYDKVADFSNTSGRDTQVITPKNETNGYKVDTRKIGRFLNYKIGANIFWRLSYLGLNIEPSASRR